MVSGYSSICERSRLLLTLGLAALASLGAACSETEDDVAAGNGAQTVDAPAPGFLDDAAVSDLVKIAPGFPFGVVARHAASGPALDAHWGRHGGPIVTTQDLQHPGSPLKVARWSVPAGATSAATHADLTGVVATNLPAQTFWGVDGFVDLPFDSLSMHAYSSTGDTFPGEVLFYSKDYDSVVGRAKVNGFYSGIGVADGQAKRLVYSGLSALSTESVWTKDCGLYASDVCQGSPVPSGSCAESVKLVGWQGNSGPVTSDANGNVFVAAFVTEQGGAESDLVYGLTKGQSFGAAAQHAATLSTKKTGGTASIAAISAPGTDKGWVIAKGHDGKEASPSYAVAYKAAGGALEVSGSVVDKAIVGTSPDASLSFFADPKGHLWVAVETPKGSSFLELSPRP